MQAKGTRAGQGWGRQSRAPGRREGSKNDRKLLAAGLAHVPVAAAMVHPAVRVLIRALARKAAGDVFSDLARAVPEPAASTPRASGPASVGRSEPAASRSARDRPGPAADPASCALRV